MLLDNEIIRFMLKSSASVFNWTQMSEWFSVLNRSAFFQENLWTSSPVSHCDLFQHGRTCVGLPVTRNGCSPEGGGEHQEMNSYYCKKQAKMLQQQLIAPDFCLCDWRNKPQGGSYHQFINDDHFNPHLDNVCVKANQKHSLMVRAGEKNTMR